MWRQVARWGYRRASQCWTVSSELAHALQARYQRTFEVIPNYPVLQVGEGRQPVRKQALVYVGVLNAGRGLEFAIDCMHEIDAELWILGEGDLSSELRARSQRQNLQHKVNFKGWVPKDQIAAVLREAKIGLNLLDQRSASYRYSLANKFFDYVHAGTPQICMHYPAYQRLVQEYPVARTLSGLDRDAFVAACTTLLSDHEQWLKHHQAAQDARMDWRFEIIASKILRLAHQLSP